MIEPAVVPPSVTCWHKMFLIYTANENFGESFVVQSGVTNCTVGDCRK